MRRLILITAMTSLAACFHPPSYDVAKVEADFKVCMNATPASSSPVALDNKIDACKEAAWASAKARSES